jgi:sulfotransferase
MSGPLAGLFDALLAQMSARNEFSVFLDDAKRQRILRGLFDSYYNDSVAEVIFDTNRAWCARLPAIAQLFPNAKVVACVRELPWVIDSIERLVQRNVFSPSSIFNYSPGGTVYTRANDVAAQDGMVGAPYDALKQACYGAQRDRLLLVQYETLTTEPAKVMHAIYEFIGETVFEHDFSHVDYDVTEFDDRAGTPGLHTVRGEVKAEPRETVLPPDLFNRFVRDAFWRDPSKVPDGLRVV